MHGNDKGLRGCGQGGHGVTMAPELEKKLPVLDTKGVTLGLQSGTFLRDCQGVLTQVSLFKLT